MHKLYELKEKLIKELEDYADNGKFSKEDVEAIKYTASAIDHICNIMEDADEEYSGRSYRYEGEGSYARGRGRNARRDAMGRYSRRDGMSYADGMEMIETIRGMMGELPEGVRHDAERLVQKMEREIR